MSLFKLDNMVTPKILTGIYILTTILAILTCLMNIFNGSLGAAIAWGLVALFNRIFFECIIVAFKNNEYLKSSSASLQQIAALLAETVAENKRKTVGNAAPDADFTEATKESDKSQAHAENPQDKQ